MTVVGEEAGPLVSSLSFRPHPDRAAILAEVHARPFHPLSTPARLLHFAFLTDAEQGAADRTAFAAYCAAHGVSGPAEGARHHRAALGGMAVRWEQHSEFTTYTWELVKLDGEPFTTPASVHAAPMRQIPQPGPHLVSIDLQVRRDEGVVSPARLFDAAGLAMAEIDDGAALAAMDFRAGPDGFVRVLLLDRELPPQRAGTLAQHLLEIETYRTLALLGLPVARRSAPSVRTIEDSLIRLSRELLDAGNVDDDQRVLSEITRLAAQLEADVATSSYRFGASRAYDRIVHERLSALGERPVGGWPTFSAFLARRVGPAMRTCEAIEARQGDLARKLARAANLLRTRVEVEISRQNTDLLHSMDRRARIQLRLQQTVEGLSVAAVSYYVVGLLSYVFKGLHDGDILPIDPVLATAAVVPLVVLGLFLAVRHIRASTRDDP